MTRKSLVMIYTPCNLLYNYISIIQSLYVYITKERLQICERRFLSPSLVRIIDLFEVYYAAWPLESWTKQSINFRPVVWLSSVWLYLKLTTAGALLCPQFLFPPIWYLWNMIIHVDTRNTYVPLCTEFIRLEYIPLWGCMNIVLSAFKLHTVV